DIAGHAERIVRLRDGRIVSDFPTSEDPMHQAYLKRAAEAAVSAAHLPEGAGAQAAGGPA
ncbi:MAG TPA: hypothetical protein VK176_09790, partial [Phycisphaerales bacterium]|nr:hypothetical protein [Phycisphaerales bacterium]